MKPAGASHITAIISVEHATVSNLGRLDPKTGEVVEYLMPTELDTKKILLDPSSSRTVLLMTNMRNARILRVEPLD